METEEKMDQLMNKISMELKNETLQTGFEIICKRIAQTPKWHEIESQVAPKREILKKYMPKPKEKVLLKYHFYNDEEIHFSDGYYDPYDFDFHIPNNPTAKIICVIAWCDLSRF